MFALKPLLTLNILILDRMVLPQNDTRRLRPEKGEEPQCMKVPICLASYLDHVHSSLHNFVDVEDTGPEWGCMSAVVYTIHLSVYVYLAKASKHILGSKGGKG